MQVSPAVHGLDSQGPAPSFIQTIFLLSASILISILDKVMSCIHGNYDAKQSHLMFNRPIYGQKKGVSGTKHF